MDSIGSGLIYTTHDCIWCNKCVSVCPVIGANVAKIKDGKLRIRVDNDKCIHCGSCISACQHNARKYIDDTDPFFIELKLGKPISVLVSPSFFIEYPEEASHVLGWLKSLGVNKIYDISLGSVIASWAYENYMEKNPKHSVISSPCNSIVNYIEKKRPELIPNLIPIKSPLVCMATYVRKHLGNTDNLAFISPCISKKDEIDDPQFAGLLNYNVTFSHLMEHASQVDISSFDAIPDNVGQVVDNNFSIRLGLKDSFDIFDRSDRFAMHLSGISYLTKDKNSLVDIFTADKERVILDIFQCEHGCIMGTGCDKSHCDFKKIIDNYNVTRKFLNSKEGDNIVQKSPETHQQYLARLNERFKDFDLNDYKRTYTNRYVAPPEISPLKYEEVFKSMHKYTEQDRTINCQSCGYKTCRQMAKAIALGFNVRSNCSKYEREENIKLYTTDGITGLPNSYQFNVRTQELIDKGQLGDYAVAYFNIKNFSVINTSIGFSKGNLVLRFFAEAAQKLLNEGEYIFALGGDKFLALLLESNLYSYINGINHSQYIQERLRNLMPRELFDNGVELSVRAAVYHCSGVEKNSEELIDYYHELATSLKVESKKNLDIVEYDESATEKLIQNLAVAQAIPFALQNNEFFVVYQPKVNLQTREMQGAEALIRWKHNGKTVSPGAFIPTSELNGFIVYLDFFVLKKVCSNIALWLKKGIEPVKISCNFSKVHFNMPLVAERIINIIDSYKVPHKYIEIEFTESAYHQNKDLMCESVQQLQAAGIDTAIDDFGVGSSSVLLLQAMPAKVIKLDKSLIDTMKGSARARVVVAELIHMADKMNMEVVAEGVEESFTADELTAINCHMIQGYYFDRPLMYKDFVNKLSRHRIYDK